MLIDELLDELGYAGSPFYLSRGTREFETAANVGHIFRAAAKPECGLLGVYTLSDIDAPDSAPAPVVYVCRAKTEADADNVHRLVWNQDITPFVIVHTPKGIKFYSGFEYSHGGTGHLTSLLAFNEAFHIAKTFHAEEINSGRFWKEWSSQLRPDRRVNWKLLDNLNNLDKHLQRECGVSRQTSHALIGKYVYLNYLRDRDILSDRKLETWGVTASDVFGRYASFTKVKLVVAKLEDWLNGNIFPLRSSGKDAPTAEHIRVVAGVFNGDDILPLGDRQLTLDFQAYDFSYIPIETLSVVYEQFLHTPNEQGESKGKEEGAYYTPIPVVNFMLGEMEQTCPLEDGVKVLDPACGSGAFLVQCYRRLIEKTYPQHKHSTVHPIPLKKLLVDNIFGLDRDEDACAVTELSLLLTLLDYVSPPDLEDDKRVTLPTLRDRNIFCEDFFNPLPGTLKRTSFQWIVGNPPWKKLNPRKLKDNDRPAWKWMQENQKERPVGGNELARAFAWRVTELAGDDGEIGLFMPAMTLFDKRAAEFRRTFFDHIKLRSVANFSNLAEVISAGRFRVPSACFFYTPHTDEVVDHDRAVKVFSPLVANQEVTRPEGKGERIESWCIVVNESEIRDIPYVDIVSGSGLPWKIATWGSHNDVKLLRGVSRRFPSLADLENDSRISISEGPVLRSEFIEAGPEKNEFREELVGKNVLDISALARFREVFSIPQAAIRRNQKHYLRRKTGISVCRGPHVVVSAARAFSVYVEDYLVIPPRQIGIVSPNDDRDLLKALSLFLSSDFAFYHQFFTASQFGVKRDVATLDALKRMPCPLAGFSKADLKPWVRLHQKLVKTSPRRVGDSRRKTDAMFDEDDNLDALLVELNALVFDSLGLTERDRALVTEFVNIRLELNDGKVGRPAVEKPNTNDLNRYAKRLRQELDDFLGAAASHWHSVDVIHDESTGMVCVDFVKSKMAITTSVAPADRSASNALAATRDELREEIGQWVYFNRDLRIHDGTKTYLFKPMQRFHWTESQAMVDASEIIAETVSAEGADA